MADHYPCFLSSRLDKTITYVENAIQKQDITGMEVAFNRLSPMPRSITWE